MNERGRRPHLDSRITFIVVILLFLAPTFAAADGMAFYYRPTSLDPLEVDEQRAIIAHKDGIQRMFIAITLGKPASAEDASQAAVWIFPVPGNPNRADVEVTDFIPELTGKDVGRAFRDAMYGTVVAPIASQPVLLPFALFPFVPMAAVMGMRDGAFGVTTHKKVDRWGIHAELISADSVDRLAEYLRKQNVGVQPEKLKPFASYLSDKYTLVVAWIRSYDELIKKFPRYSEERVDRRPSLYVEFPTDKPFYPMRPTSGYGKKAITVTLYLAGFRAPDMSSWKAAERKAVSPEVTHYSGDKEVLDRSYRAFLSKHEKESEATEGKSSTDGQRKAVERFLEAVTSKDVRFTRLMIRAPAENFTHDLLFSPSSRAHFMYSVVSKPWVLAPLVIVLLALYSYVSGGISGKLIFGSWKRWARMGLWNCLTIAALVAATWVSRRDLDPTAKPVTASPRWESLVFGALVCVPLQLLVVLLYRLSARPSNDLILQVLFVVLITAELVIAAWIVSKPGSAWPNARQPGSEIKRRVIARGIKESFVRVVLMCTTSFVVVFPILPLVLMSGGPWALISLPRTFLIALLILYSVVTAVGLTTAAWIFRKRETARPSGRDSGLKGKIAAVAGRKPEALVLGALTFIVSVVLVTSVIITSDLSTYGSMLRIGCFCTIAALLIIATWIVWKGAPVSDSREVEVSPWPVAIAVLLALLTVGEILTYITANLLHDGPDFFTRKNVNVSGMSFLPTVCFAGVIALIGFFNRKHLKRFRHGMTYKDALSVNLVILGILSYVGLFQQCANVIVRGDTVRDTVVVFALLCGTWLVKGELQDGPTKALRFGVLFSFVFALLTLTAFLGMRTLLASLGI